MYERVSVGLSFISERIKKWHKFFKPIGTHSEVNFLLTLSPRVPLFLLTHFDDI